ncbi:MAG: 6,7-dimethyl-8-ribityllumazine synthase [Gammaproteobacteria bacterium]
MKSKYAIIVSQFNQEITHELAKGALSRLLEHGVSEDCVTMINVPGAVEIPLTAKLLARSEKYAAIICLGAVIRGETDHYDYVCQQVCLGCQQVMTDYDVPVIFGVLTTKNLKQAKARAGGKEGHKGRDAADAAIEMTAVVARLKSTVVCREVV